MPNVHDTVHSQRVSQTPHSNIALEQLTFRGIWPRTCQRCMAPCIRKESHKLEYQNAPTNKRLRTKMGRCCHLFSINTKTYVLLDFRLHCGRACDLAVTEGTRTWTLAKIVRGNSPTTCSLPCAQEFAWQTAGARWHAANVDFSFRIRCRKRAPYIH